jgi:eukaryotic-like serine/threonine-protein kinase
MGGEAAAVPRTVGRYVVYGEIASGGMATVHFGRLTGVAGFARSVAIKRLHPQYARDPDFVKMFLDEARLAARITHPNVVATLDVVSEGEDLFLVMDYVRGVSLSEVSRILRARGERIPPLAVTGILAGALHGLHAAHDARGDTGERLDIVHRDVSPQNILVGTDGVARVLDFGVAKAAGRLQTTRDGQLKGKLSYMAPEQIQGEPVTRRTDLYAASVVLWEALTGERLFKGENEGNVLAKVLAGEVRAPSAVVPSLPDALDRVVLRGLERDPGKRYATAREMAQELDAALGLASPAEIGDWVEHVAARELEARAKKIAHAQAGTTADDDDAQTTVAPSSPGKGAPDAPTPVGQRVPEEPTLRRDAELETRAVVPEVSSQVSSVSVSQTAIPPAATSRPRALWIGLAAGGVALVGIIAFVVASHGSGSSPQAASAPSAPPSVPAAAPTPDPSPSAAPEPSSSTDVPTIEASALPSVPAPSATPAVAAPARPAPRPAPRADCTPPYTTDAKGHVHFKPQCM